MPASEQSWGLSGPRVLSPFSIKYDPPTDSLCGSPLRSLNPALSLCCSPQQMISLLLRCWPETPRDAGGAQLCALERLTGDGAAQPMSMLLHSTQRFCKGSLQGFLLFDASRYDYPSFMDDGTEAQGDEVTHSASRSSKPGVLGLTLDEASV